MRWARSFIANALFLLVLPGLLQAGDALPRAGQEFELAIAGPIQADAAKQPREVFLAPLQEVKKILGDPHGKITFEPWGKWAGAQAVKAVYRDPKGRVWEVVPEKVSTPIEGFDGRRGFDGIELVTPPLESEAEIEKAHRVIGRLIDSGKYERGIQSSNHNTIEVAHLLGDKKDARSLRNLILTIENHWPEIYASLSPRRYGTPVNWFSIPLAADQPDLLRELAAIPSKECTFDRLKSLFEKYHGKEILLKGDDHSAWKYRAVNYRKLFGIGGTPQIPAIEFRVPDLLTRADFNDGEKAVREAVKNTAFLRHLVQFGPDMDSTPTFLDPFHGIVNGGGFNPFEGHYDDTYVKDLSRRVFEETRPAEVSKFLGELHLKPWDYPPFRLIRDPHAVPWAHDLGRAWRSELVPHSSVRGWTSRRRARVVLSGADPDRVESLRGSLLARAIQRGHAPSAVTLEWGRGGSVILGGPSSMKADLMEHARWLEALSAAGDIEWGGGPAVKLGGELIPEMEHYARERVGRGLSRVERKALGQLQNHALWKAIPSPFELEKEGRLHDLDAMKLLDAGAELRYEVMELLSKNLPPRERDRLFAGRIRAWVTKAQLPEILIEREVRPRLMVRAQAAHALESALRTLCRGGLSH